MGYVRIVEVNRVISLCMPLLAATEHKIQVNPTDTKIDRKMEGDYSIWTAVE